jgi:hypothetical protein
MKPSALPRRPEEHPSYQVHRKQVWTQILLPVILAVALFAIALTAVGIATFRDNGDVGRWAAISTIGLILPVMIAGVLLLALLGVMIYVMGRITRLIPPYSYQAQRIVYRLEGGIKHAAGMVRRPVLALQELAGMVKAYLQKAQERM